MDKPSVLIVDNCLHGMGTGARSQGEELAAQLASLGWQTICTSSIRPRIPRLAHMALTAWRRRTDYAAAVVCVYSGPAFVWAETVAHLLRQMQRPFVLALHGGNLPQFCRSHPRRAARLFANAAAVVSPSPYLATALNAYRPDIQVLPNGVDLTAYHYRPRGPVRPRLVWIRAFHSIYRPLLAVEAIRLLRESGIPAELTMIGRDKGDGTLQAARRYVAEARIHEAVHFAGGIDRSEIPARIHCGDIFLNTAAVDNTPVSVLEALVSGLCVVSTNVGGIPFLLEHERTALLVPPDDSIAIAATIRQLLNEPALAALLSREGHAASLASGWNQVLPRWTTLLVHSASNSEPVAAVMQAGGAS